MKRVTSYHSHQIADMEKHERDNIESSEISFLITNE